VLCELMEEGGRDAEDGRGGGIGEGESMVAPMSAAPISAVMLAASAIMGWPQLAQKGVDCSVTLPQERHFTIKGPHWVCGYITKFEELAPEAVQGFQAGSP